MMSYTEGGVEICVVVDAGGGTGIGSRVDSWGGEAGVGAEVGSWSKTWDYSEGIGDGIGPGFGVGYIIGSELSFGRSTEVEYSVGWFMV